MGQQLQGVRKCVASVETEPLVRFQSRELISGDGFLAALDFMFFLLTCDLGFEHPAVFATAPLSSECQLYPRQGLQLWFLSH